MVLWLNVFVFGVLYNVVCVVVVVFCRVFSLESWVMLVINVMFFFGCGLMVLILLSVNFS